MVDGSVGDHLLRGVVEGANVRAVACVTTQLVREACRRHGTQTTASVALGRALSAAALWVALLKGDQRVSLKFEGNGPLRTILAEADADGAVRGSVGDPTVDLPRSGSGIAVAAALGRAGFLTVTKDLGLKQPYSGRVQLYNSEIAADLAYYFTESEQLPSAVGLGVFLDTAGQVAAAGGFLFQCLPPTDPAIIEALAHRTEHAPPLSELLLQGKSPQEVLETLLGELSFAPLERRSLRWQCSCSQARVEQALTTLGRAQLEEMLIVDAASEITCSFCGQPYRVTATDLERLLCPFSQEPESPR